MIDFNLPMVDGHLVGCLGCKHFNRQTMATCAAYPKGIPPGITGGDFDHRKPLPGDNGIQYEPEERP